MRVGLGAGHGGSGALDGACPYVLVAEKRVPQAWSSACHTIVQRPGARCSPCVCSLGDAAFHARLARSHVAAAATRAGGGATRLGHRQGGGIGGDGLQRHGQGRGGVGRGGRVRVALAAFGLRHHARHLAAGLAMKLFGSEGGHARHIHRGWAARGWVGAEERLVRWERWGAICTTC